MTGRLLVGLDVGTTGSKARVYTEDGAEVAAGSAPTPWTAASAGAEVAPAALLAAVHDAIGRALAGAPAGHVAGVGVASMGESGVLLDSGGDPLGPVIAWHDTRDAVELADLGHRIDPAVFARTTGLPLRHQWSITKHRWLLSRIPETARAVRRLDIAAWVVHSLGGEQASELSLASRTGWLRLDSRDWWDRSLEWSGTPAGMLPPLVQAGTALGTVGRGPFAERLGGATLTVAGHDHQAAAIGAGAVGPADELDSCGTAEALVRSVAPGLSPDAVGRLVEGGVTVGWHALPGRWCLLGGTTGGLDLQRVLGALGLDAGDIPALDRALAAPAPPGGDAAVGPATVSAPAVQAWRDALESVTADAGAVHDVLRAVAGPPGAFVVTGGWSRSRGLMAAKERRFGPLRIARVGEAGARGAALLAGLAAGSYGGVDEFPQLPHTSAAGPGR